MSQLKFGSAGVSAREVDLSGPVASQPVGVPAGVIGTSVKGPAFVPITVAVIDDFYAKFGKTDGQKFGPLAVNEWLKKASAVTYLRPLGIGDGTRRVADGNLEGTVNDAGFVVGEKQPLASTGGLLSANPFANAGGPLGRTYVLGCFMSESAGSTAFSDAGLQGIGGVTPNISSSVPIVRGLIMAPSGVILKLSSSAEGNNAKPSTGYVAVDTTCQGGALGAVVLLDGGVAKQDFVLLLNGHRGTDASYPNVITASFDVTDPKYFANVLNRDPFKFQDAGHFLYTNWDIHPALATVTGTALVLSQSGAGAASAAKAGVESSAFLLTSSLARNVGSATVPNYENFQDRFDHAKSPWLVSQKFGGSPVNLFRIHALDDGAGISSNLKLSVENIVQSSDPTNRFGTFDVVIRDWNDRDGNVVYVEQWRGLSLDPRATNYVAKIIGDTHAFYDFDRATQSQKLVVDGNYPNSSNLIRVEVSQDVEAGNVDPSALPVGFRGVYHLVTSGSAPMALSGSTQLNIATAFNRAVQAPVPYRTSITAGSGVKQSVNQNLYWGTQFEHVTDLTTPNASTLHNGSLESFATYLPDFSNTNANVAVGDNQGTADTTANGILDADRFDNNLFTLENVMVVTASNGLADPRQWVSARYVRAGTIAADETNKTRAFKVDDLIQSNRRFAKFTFFMQGGFDGVNLFDRDEAQLTNNAVTADMNDSNRNTVNGPNVVAYTKALDIMKNTSEVDIQLLAVPGIRHAVVSNAAIDAVESRFDALYIMDVEQYDNMDALVEDDEALPSVSLTVASFKDRALNSSFAAAYFPDVVIPDPNTKTNVVAPPSVAVLGALALNDALGHPWFAPAGFARGALASTLEARVKLSKDNMDALYDAAINPITAFPGNAQGGLNPKGGVVVWGQKTLLATASALDRVNVRRLLIEIRRQVRQVANGIIFEPNRETTLAKFSAAITPKLQRIQALSGLERFKVSIDASTTTQQDVENNTVRGKIFVQPIKSIEFVSLDFVVTNNIGGQIA